MRFTGGIAGHRKVWTFFRLPSDGNRAKRPRTRSLCLEPLETREMLTAVLSESVLDRELSDDVATVPGVPSPVVGEGECGPLRPDDAARAAAVVNASSHSGAKSGLPDLLGRYFNSPEPLRWGQVVRLNAQVVNRGSATAGASTVQFFVSNNSIISSLDVYLGSAHVDYLSAGYYRRITDTVRLPYRPPPGFTKTDTVYIGMIVDARQEVSESDGGNNRNQGTGIDRDRVLVRPTKIALNGFQLHKRFGGKYHDAEKKPGNRQDDEMCWGAAASNVLAWTGWGRVGNLTNTDQIFRYFQRHWTDQGGDAMYGWNWWFDGIDRSRWQGPGWARVDVPGGGFYSTNLFNSAFRTQGNDQQVISSLNQYLRSGYGTTLGILTPGGGHEIACWGVTFRAGSPSNIVGVWVSDSDDNMQMRNAPNRLRYYGVLFIDGRWYLNGYGSSNWYLGGVNALQKKSFVPQGNATALPSFAEQYRAGFDLEPALPWNDHVNARPKGHLSNVLVRGTLGVTDLMPRTGLARRASNSFEVAGGEEAPAFPGLSPSLRTPRLSATAIDRVMRDLADEGPSETILGNDLCEPLIPLGTISG